MVFIPGTANDDTLLDTSGDDSISGYGGSDTITVTYGQDIVDGGFGAGTEDTLIIDWSDAVLDSRVYNDNGYQGWVDASINFVDATRRVSILEIEHLDVRLGSGDDIVNGRSNSWDKIDGGAGTDTWDDSFHTTAGAVSIDMGLMAMAGGQTLSDGTVVRNVEQASLILSLGDDSFSDHGAFDDRVSGHNGNDVFEISDGRDFVDGGAGTDTLWIKWGDATLDVSVGRATAHVHTHTDWNDSLRRAQYMRVESLNVETGSGNDFFEATDGDDVIRSGKGRDEIRGNLGNDQLYGGGGADVLTCWDGNDMLFGGTGNDVIAAGDGDDLLNGGSGKDTLTGGGGGDELIGGRHRDTVVYTDSAAAVTVNLTSGLGSGGDAAGDTFSSVEIVLGSNYADTISGNAANNALNGGLGDDTLVGFAGKDVLEGDYGNDTLRGRGGGDTLFGFYGVDTLDGGNGNDTLSGEGGNDILIGGNGKDRLNGGGNNDILTGGKKADTFIFNRGEDTITDFRNNVDSIVLDGADLALGSKTVAQILRTAVKVGGDIEIDFGFGDVLTIEGFSNINALKDDMEIA